MDTSAGPSKDRTVVFLGSEDGRVLKVLSSTHPNASFGSQLLEDIDVYNPSKSVQNLYKSLYNGFSNSKTR